MAKNLAYKAGSSLEETVALIGEKLGLRVDSQVKAGRRLWGQERHIDIVLTQAGTGKKLGIECKFQAKSGTAQEKIPSTILDIQAWPIQGIVVFSGDGFTANMENYLHSTGKAVALEDLENWLRLYFSL
ncbi:hypothetical protein K2X33_13465 [bacterium]|nr:hypothetical protein [bacterium]